MAESGGVIGVCAVPFFTTSKSNATLEDVLDHVDYIANLVGPEHLGLDFDFVDEDEDDYAFYGYDERYVPHPPWTWPTGISGHAEAGNVAEGLRVRGYSESASRGILGENFLRVFEQVWGE